MSSSSLGFVDMCVFSVCSAIPLIIGVVILMRSGTQSTSREYFLGGQNQGVLPVLLSLAVSFQSSILMLGVPAEAYLYGAMPVVRMFEVVFIIPFLVKIVAPIIYNLKLTSVNEYFGRRFPTMKVRYLMVWGSVLTNTCYGGLVLVGPAMVLHPMIGVPSWVIIIVMSLVAVAYTSLGGIRAVLWTDVFQCLVMIAGLVAVTIKCTIEAGGPSNVIDIARRYKRLDLFDFNPDPTVRHTFWTLIIGSTFQALILIFSQQTVQRMNSLPTLRQAQFTAAMRLPLHYLGSCMAIACGLAIFAYYQNSGCDPLAAGIVVNPNGIIVRAIHDVFRSLPGLTGLFLAALVAASLSTLSSCLNGLAAIICEDFVKLRWKTISEKKATAVSKLSVVVMGVTSTLLALILQFARGNLAQLFGGLFGAIGGPVVGVYLLSILYKKTTTTGVFAGAVTGFSMALWLLYGYGFSSTLPQTPWLPLGDTGRCVSPDTNTSMTFLNDTAEYQVFNYTSIGPQRHEKRDPQGLDRLYSLSYMYFSVVTSLLTVVVGGIVSRLSFSRAGSPVAPDDHVMDIRSMFGCLVPRLWKYRQEQDRLPSEVLEIQTERMIDTRV